MKRIVLVVFLIAFCSIPSFSQKYQLSKPIVNVENNGFFQNQIAVSLEFKLEGAIIRYTLDGTEPAKSSKRYKKPLIFHHSSVLKVRTFKKGFLPSETVTHELMKVGRKIEIIEITPMANERYAGMDKSTLDDLKAGSLYFQDGNWLGFDKGPIEITIDLGQSDPAKEVVISALSSPASWIMPPESMKLLYSKDGDSFINYSEVQIFPLTEMESARKDYSSINLESIKARYIKIIISPVTKLPNWHPGKGNPAWVFLDEIIVR